MSSSVATTFSRQLRLLSVLLWASALAWFSLVPEVGVAGSVRIWDKFGHFAAYAVLAVLLVRARIIKPVPTPHLLTKCWLACAGYGLLLESMQWAMALGRRFEPGDLLANALGALAGCVVFCRVTGRR